MEKNSQKRSAEDLYKEASDYQFETPEIKLGPWTSYSLINDPKHMCFVLSRYKFCSKMLEGKKVIMEVGIGDGFGLPLMAQGREMLHAVDWDKRLVDGNAERLPHLQNVTYHHADLNKSSLNILVDAVFAIDVIEHLEPEKEGVFLKNMFACLKKNGVAIIGTPNITASQYATPRSEVQHINLKSMNMLRELLEKYFKNVFMFGMNDDVVHVGYAPMCHYLWAIGSCKK